MTATTSKLGADMTDEQKPTSTALQLLAQIQSVKDGWTLAERDEARAVALAWRPDDGDEYAHMKRLFFVDGWLYHCGRVALARQPAAIDKEAVFGWVQDNPGAPDKPHFILNPSGPGITHDRVAVYAAPPDKEASKIAAPSVEQDERGAFEAHIRNECDDAGYADMILRTNAHGFYHVTRIQGAWEGWQARAASTSANVAQGLSLTAEQSYAIKKFDEWASDKGLPAYSALLTASKLPSELTHEMYNAADAAGFGHIAERDLQKLWQTLLAANVAQGAEAVATVKVYETYTGQNGWIEVTQEEYDRTKDKYEHRIRRVPAPPARTALTDDARDAARYRFLRAGFGDMGPEVDMHNAFVDGGEVMDRTIDAALTAAQSASEGNHAG